MIKESRNLVRALQDFAEWGDDAARITNMIGKKNIARFNSMFNRNLAAAQAGKPYDQKFMDIMYPKLERMFVNNQLPTRDFRRIYSKSKLFNNAKDTILYKNNDIGLARAFSRPRKYSLAERREGLQYLRGLRKHTDLSEKVSDKLDDLDYVREHSNRRLSKHYEPGWHYVGDSRPDITSFAKSQRLLSREALLRQAKKENITLNKKDLHEPFYINKGTALESSQAVPKSPWIRDVVPAVDSELKHVKYSLNEANKRLQQAPRSVHRAKAIVEGQNVLQPGTRANRFYTKLLRGGNPNIRRLLPDEILDETLQGTNAFYNVDGNYIAVNPISSKLRNKDILNPAGTKAHELGHFFAYNSPDAAHKAVATTLFAKLKRAAARYNLDIPFNNSNLMHEAFADGYAALKLGKVKPFDTRLNYAFYKAKLNETDPRTYRTMIRNLKKINKAKDLDDVTKQMLNQLQINYNADIFKNWK